MKPRIAADTRIVYAKYFFGVFPSLPSSFFLRKTEHLVFAWISKQTSIHRISGIEIEGRRDSIQFIACPMLTLWWSQVGAGRIRNHQSAESKHSLAWLAGVLSCVFFNILCFDQQLLSMFLGLFHFPRPCKDYIYHRAIQKLKVMHK